MRPENLSGLILLEDKMSEEVKQLATEDLFAISRVTYTQSTLIAEKLINLPFYIGAFTFGLFIFGFILVVWPDLALIFFVFPAAILIFAIVSGSSYRYEINKEKREIVRKYGGVLGTPWGKTESTYSLDEVEYLRVDQSWTRRRNTFGIKLVLACGVHVDLPSADSLGECMEYVNLYRDFLDISVKLP